MVFWVLGLLALGNAVGSPALNQGEFMSKITDIHEMTQIAPGVFQKNFNGANDWRGFLTADPAVLNKRWYVRYKVRYESNWNWGFASAEGKDGCHLSNVKIFRMWNPSAPEDANENFVIALMGWEDGAMASMEYIGEQNERFLSGFKNILKPGTEHVWEFEYVDSEVGQSDGYCKVWLDGKNVLDWQGLMTRKAFSGLKRPYVAAGHENVWPSDRAQGDNTMIVSDVVVAEGVSRDQYVNAVVTPTPTGTPGSLPAAGVTKVEFNAWVDKVAAAIKALKV